MHCNIIRNNNKSDLSVTSTTNNIKNFPDKNFNRSKIRIQSENNNAPFKAYRYNKSKKFNKRTDDNWITDNEISKSNLNNVDQNNLEPFAFKYTNGNGDKLSHKIFPKNERFSPEKMFELNKRKFNVCPSYNSKLENYTVEIDNNLSSNAPIVDQDRLIGRQIVNNFRMMENKLKKSTQEDCSSIIKPEKRKCKWATKKTVENTKSLSLIKSSEKLNNNNNVNININNDNCHPPADKNHLKIKLNFLQESQLTLEQLSESRNNNNNNSNSNNNNNNKFVSTTVDFYPNNTTSLNRNKNQQINGLNPSAVEFTPSGDKKIIEKLEKLSSESIDNSMKILTISGDNNNQPISNPIVLDDISMNPSFNFSYYDHQHHNHQQQQQLQLHHHQQQQQILPYTSTKLLTTTSNDSTTILSNVYPYPSNMQPLASHQMSRLSYPPSQTIVPQFQVALYGANNTPPQLFRYNQSQNVPINMSGGGYLVYSPVMINNGMYNSLLSNRVFPMSGGCDIPNNNLSTPFAHPFTNTIISGNTNTNNNNNTTTSVINGGNTIINGANIIGGQQQQSSSSSLLLSPSLSSSLYFNDVINTNNNNSPHIR